MHQFEIGTIKHQNENLELFKKMIYQNQKLADFICQTGWNFGEIECMESTDSRFIEINPQNIQMKKNFLKPHLLDDV